MRGGLGCRVLLALSVALLAGCSGSVSVGDAAVSSEEIEEQAREQFSQQFPVDSVDCEDDLPAEEGAAITCVLVSEGQSFEMTATATTVEGSDVNFDLELTAEL